MYDQVIRFLSDHHLIPSEQHGFLPGKSVQSNLMCCMSEWTRSLDSERPFDVVYLDFSKAFDRVPKCRLLRKLSYLDIRGHLLRWIDSFLSDRTFRVRIGGALSRSVDVLSGVPQGSVLGPLLFIAYTADIKDILTSPFAMYADDIKLYNSCDNIQRLTQDLHAIYKWSLDWLLPLNVDKSTSAPSCTLVEEIQDMRTHLGT
jgi:ribonuclease P/MRP protein subunit RPP40